MQEDQAVATRSPDEDVTLLEAPVHVRVRQRAGHEARRVRHEARRVRHGLRRPANWFQLVRFSIAGGTGYVINLVVYSALVEALGVHYIPAAMLAFCVAVTNNFLLNRQWTFNA